jgi:low affinity Fe/Cu permease
MCLSAILRYTSSFFSNISAVPLSPIDAFDGSRQPSIANVRPPINPNSAQYANTFTNVSLNFFPLQDMKSAKDISYMNRDISRLDSKIDENDRKTEKIADEVNLIRKTLNH